MDDDATTPHARAGTIIEQIDVLTAIALRTMDLTRPVVEGSVTGCRMMWRNPSRRIVLTSRPARFNSGETDIEIEVRRPGTARRILVEGASWDSCALPRPSDPAGSVVDLLSAVKAGVGTLLTYDKEVEEFEALGMTMAFAEGMGIPDERWTLSTGSPLLGSGRLSSSRERNVSTMRGLLPPVGGVLVSVGEGCAMPIDQEDVHDPRNGSEAPLLCTIDRPGIIVDLSRHDAASRLRALAQHIARSAP